MPMIISAILLIVFTVNVALGSVSGDPILGNVGEMVLLFIASGFFVAGILRAEAAAKKTNDTKQ